MQLLLGGSFLDFDRSYDAEDEKKEPKYVNQAGPFPISGLKPDAGWTEVRDVYARILVNRFMEFDTQGDSMKIPKVWMDLWQGVDIYNSACYQLLA